MRLFPFDLNTPDRFCNIHKIKQLFSLKTKFQLHKYESDLVVVINLVVVNL